MRHTRLVIIIAGLAAGSFAAPAYANPEDGVGRSLTVGGAVLVKPKYEGSDSHDVIGFPIIIPKFSDDPDKQPSAFKSFRQRVKFRGLDDIRVRAVGGDRLQAGAVTGYITDRDQGDGRLLRGLGDVEGGLVLGGYAGFRLGAVDFDAAYIDKVTGDESGFEFRFGAETTRQVTERVKVVARVGTTFASDGYMQTYFGVTPAQAASSRAGLPVYDPDAGIKDVYVELGSEIALGERWLLKPGGRYGRLVGDAGDSPIVENENQFSGVLGMGYKFHLPN